MPLSAQRISLILFCFLLIVPGAFAQKKAKTKPPAKVVEFVDYQNKVAFLPPVGWKESIEGSGIVERYKTDFRKAYQGPATGEFIPVILFDIDDQVPLDTLPPALGEAILNLVDQIIRKEFPNANVLNTATIKIGGENAVVAAFSEVDPDSKQLTKGRVIFTIHKKRLYLFFFQSDFKAFDKRVVSFEKMMNSLRFLPE